MQLVGIGQDSHAFETELKKPLIFGGIKISDNGGLKGNSDADVILHSICNALSSAIGGDSLGTWSDEMCLKQGIKDSKKYLEIIFNKVSKNHQVINISIAVEAQKPRLSTDQITLIKQNVADLLDIKLNRVGLTFTSGENLTAFGQGLGIQVFSCVNLQTKHD
jgi:2-C-methyl-D-erythritol 2,4-cyclodiphosphate synthase